jgi:hypothetical protein
MQVRYGLRTEWNEGENGKLLKEIGKVGTVIEGKMIPR